MQGMDPLEFLDLANAIAANGAAGARSAVSRAYYGVFHLAIAVLGELDCPLEGSRSHGLVVNLLRSVDSSDAREAANMLGDLQGHRVKADYRLQIPAASTQANALLCIKRGLEIKAYLLKVRESCKDSATKTKLAKSVKEYRRITRQ